MTPDEQRLYILYDERAAITNTDDATVFCTADSDSEAKEDAKDFEPCVCFSYAHGEKIKGRYQLVDERYEWAYRGGKYVV